MWRRVVAQGGEGRRRVAQGRRVGGAGLHGRHGHLRVLCCGHGAAIQSAPLSAALSAIGQAASDSAILSAILGQATIRRAVFKVVSGEACHELIGSPRSRTTSMESTKGRVAGNSAPGARWAGLGLPLPFGWVGSGEGSEGALGLG